jgi:hypothetical protein
MGQTLLSDLAANEPYADFEALESKIREIFAERFIQLPAHYAYREFLEWAFSEGHIRPTKHGFQVRTLTPA